MIQKPKRRYPVHPGAARDMENVMAARAALKPPNRFICIYCHAQSVDKIVHEADCPEGAALRKRDAILAKKGGR